MFRVAISGLLIVEHSQVLLSQVVGKDPAYTPLGVFDGSDVHIEHCLFENSTGALWHAGMSVGASHITMFDTTIRDMQVGIDAGASSIIDIGAYNSYTPPGGPTDVIIDSPAGTNYEGISLDASTSLNLGSARLLINQPGQPWGGTTAGVLVSNDSTLTANSNLLITGSRGQGIVVMNNSHATLTGVAVTGSGHGGLVLANLSSIDVSGGTASTPTLTLTGGNGVDLFCDSGSVIMGSANLAGVPTSQCANVQGPEAALP